MLNCSISHRLVTIINSMSVVSIASKLMGACHVTKPGIQPHAHIADQLGNTDIILTCRDGPPCLQQRPPSCIIVTATTCTRKLCDPKLVCFQLRVTVPGYRQSETADMLWCPRQDPLCTGDHEGGRHPGQEAAGVQGPLDLRTPSALRLRPGASLCFPPPCGAAVPGHGRPGLCV